MLTVGEHDTMWKDVMGRRVPNIDHNLVVLTNQMGYRNQFEVLKELKKGQIIDDRSYYKAMVTLGRVTGLLTGSEETEALHEINKLYREES